jgi:PTH2 family peptidyl-tRNA hydrolase
MNEFRGIWEAPGIALTVLPDAEGARLHQRVQTPDGGVQRSGRAVWSGDALLVASEGVRVVRALDGSELVERITGPAGEGEVRYRRSAAKQVMVYRRDLKMRKGKIAAQCAHGAMAVFFRRDTRPDGRLDIPLDGPMEIWSRSAFAKIVLSVEDEEGLLAIHAAAQRAGLPTAVITDAGRTEFHGVPTRTVVAIGPAALGEIDAITGKDGAIPCKLA